MEYKRINLRIGAGVKAELEEMAKEYGCSLNSLIAYILGSHVSTSRKVLKGLPDRLQAALVDIAITSIKPDQEPDA
jgi:hypothetical protein